MSFINEVKEQAEFLRNLIDYYGGEGKKLLDEAGNIVATHNTRSIIFIGMGTSYIAPLIIRDIIANRTSIVPLIWEAGEFLHYGLNSVTNDDVIIAISQSGESIETRKCVECLKNHKRLIAITNNSDSTMAKLSKLNLPLLGGKEESISTKTYTNTIALLLLLGNRIIGKQVGPLIREICTCADEMDLFFSHRRKEIDKAADFLKSADSLHFIARGPAMVAARQASLTWMEGVHMSANYFSGGGFRHGPFELVGENHYAVCYAPEGEIGMLVEKLGKEITGLGTKVVMFSGRNIQKGKNLFIIEIKPADERIFSITTSVPQELLLARMAQDKGLTPGEFTRISKITTIE